ncbi:MAG: sigma-70 family RNA polymerase sigma factor [Gemmatimonadaceae bacterium]|nr:sigma-70 family RNA polymerase sigma factor [Gemmatimonadaceae bacterium]
MTTRGATASDAEATLVAGCRRGEPDAQRACFDRYRDRVHSIALHFLRGDHDAAQDVTQEVFVRFFRAAPNFRADARLSTYLYRAVANACTDELRRRRRFVFGDVAEHLHPAVEPTDDSERSAVLAAVAKLSPKLRLVVLMRYFDELSYDEIAAALETTSGTVASRLSRAHAALAELLAPEPEAARV